MKSVLQKNYLIGFLIFYVLHIGMLVLVNWQNLDHIGYRGDSVFSSLSILDSTLAPIIFAIKFLYVSVFIFGVFLLFNKSISFEAALTSIILGNLFFYLPQLLNFYLYTDNYSLLTYGELKNYNWASVLELFPALSKENIIVPYLKEINLFTLLFLLIVTLIIQMKDKKFGSTFVLVLLGYFSSIYFATTFITFLSLLR